MIKKREYFQITFRTLSNNVFEKETTFLLAQIATVKLKHSTGGCYNRCIIGENNFSFSPNDVTYLKLKSELTSISRIKNIFAELKKKFGSSIQILAR